MLLFPRELRGSLIVVCLSCAPLLSTPQEVQPPAPSVQQAGELLTAKFRVDPTGFPDNYAFRLELKAKIVVSDPQKVLANALQDSQGKNMVYSMDSDMPHNWDISYSDGKPLAKNPLRVDYAFSSQPEVPEDVKFPVSQIEFEGVLTLLIDGEIDAKIPMRNVQRFSPNTTYIFQIKNDGEEDGKPAIDINFLTDTSAPKQVMIQFNPDGTVKDARNSDGTKIDTTNIRTIK